MRATHLLASIVLSMLVMSPGVAKSDAWRERQEVWWNDAALVKSAIVAGAVLAARHPELERDDASAAQLWEISSLVLAFDSMESPGSLRQLVSLSSYYLGEAAGELYSCVTVRKGSKVRRLITDLSKSGKNECQKTFGTVPSAKTGRKLCLTTAEMRSRLENLLQRIAKDTPCELEK